MQTGWPRAACDQAISIIHSRWRYACPDLHTHMAANVDASVAAFHFSEAWPVGRACVTCGGGRYAKGSEKDDCVAKNGKNASGPDHAGLTPKACHWQVVFHRKPIDLTLGQYRDQRPNQLGRPNVSLKFYECDS
jgi:hypothetical protein